MSITAIIAIIAMKNRLCTANPDLLWQLRYFSVQKDCASFVLTCSDSEVQVIDNSTTVLDGQAPQVTD